jgi:hypothetical protein
VSGLFNDGSLNFALVPPILLVSASSTDEEEHTVLMASSYATTYLPMVAILESQLARKQRHGKLTQ